MKGINAIMYADNYGGHYVVANALDYGITIIGQADEARQNRAFYVRKVIDDMFSIEVVFTKYAEYKEFSDWLLHYGLAAAGDSTAYPPMRVLVPSQEFDKFGIPQTGITFGDDPRLNAWHMVIEFQGTRDPTSFNTNAYSTFVQASADLVHAQYYYPAGTQLTGSAKGQDDPFYDIPAPARAPWTNPKPFIGPPKPFWAK